MRKVVQHPVVRLIVIIACGFVSFGLLRSLLDNWQRGDVVREQRAKLEQVKQEHTKLEERLEEATSASFVEREARNRLGFVKQGETIMLMGTPTPDESTPQTSEGESMSRWQRWWNLFF